MCRAWCLTWRYGLGWVGPGLYDRVCAKRVGVAAESAQAIAVPDSGMKGRIPEADPAGPGDFDETVRCSKPARDAWAHGRGGGGTASVRGGLHQRSSAPPEAAGDEAMMQREQAVSA